VSTGGNNRDCDIRNLCSIDPRLWAALSHMKPRPLVLLLAFVLLAHWAGLVWLRGQMPDVRPLIPMVDPLFTRIVVPTRAIQARLVPPKTHLAHVPQNTVSNVTQADVAAEPAPGQEQPDGPRDSHPSDTLAQAVAQAASAPDLAKPTDPTKAALPAAPATVASAPVIEESTPALDSWPTDTRVSYQLTGNYRGPLYGSARVQWQREQSRYQVRVDLRMALVLGVSMISQGEVSDAGLRPQVYEEQFLGSVRHLTFNGGLVKFHDGSQVLAPPALQDTVSQLVELSHRFSSGREALKVGGQVSVWLARPQGMAWWTYDVTDEETLITPELGPVPAFHLVPRPIANPSGVITVELWFAPSLQYLPVRLRISLGSGNFVDLLVEHIEQAAQTR
jgi:hypothetical protein